MNNSNIKTFSIKLDENIKKQIDEAVEKGEVKSFQEFIDKALLGKYKKISSTIIPSINKIIKKDGNLEKTTTGYEIIFKYIKKIISLGINTKDPEKIKEIFDGIDNLTYQLETKKLYVSYPKMKLDEYDKLDLTRKLKEIVIPKNINNIDELEFATGGNCHNWTLLYKEIFDELGIDSQIVLFEPQTAHSLLLLEIDGTFFIADTEGERKFNFHKISINDEISIGNHNIATITQLEKKEESNNIYKFKATISRGKVDIKSNFKPKIYGNKKDFIDFIDKKTRDYYLTEFYIYNKKLDKKTLVSFMISQSNGKIILTIEGIYPKKKIISIGKNKIPKDLSLSNQEIIDQIAKKTKTKIYKDPLIEKQIKGIIKNIPNDFMYNIL